MDDKSIEVVKEHIKATSEMVEDMIKALRAIKDALASQKVEIDLQASRIDGMYERITELEKTQEKTK